MEKYPTEIVRVFFSSRRYSQCSRRIWSMWLDSRCLILCFMCFNTSILPLCNCQSRTKEIFQGEKNTFDEWSMIGCTRIWTSSYHASWSHTSWSVHRWYPHWSRFFVSSPGGAKGPGLFFVLPCVDSIIKVDLRTGEWSTRSRPNFSLNFSSNVWCSSSRNSHARFSGMKIRRRSSHSVIWLFCFSLLF